MTIAEVYEKTRKLNAGKLFDLIVHETCDMATHSGKYNGFSLTSEDEYYQGLLDAFATVTSIDITELYALFVLDCPFGVCD